jgi:hypothetical protein
MESSVQPKLLSIINLKYIAGNLAIRVIIFGAMELISLLYLQAGIWVWMKL